jgi:hypothetical protein
MQTPILRSLLNGVTAMPRRSRTARRCSCGVSARAIIGLIPLSATGAYSTPLLLFGDVLTFLGLPTDGIGFDIGVAVFTVICWFCSSGMGG